MKAVDVLLAAIVCFSVDGAPFQNFDFEQANTNHLSYDSSSRTYSGSIQDLLPSWQLQVAYLPKPSFFPGQTNLVDSLFFNSAPPLLESTAVRTDDNVYPFRPKPATYSLFLTTAFGDSLYTLSQRGDVPADATTLKLDGVFGWSGGQSPGQATMDGILLVGSAFTGWDVSPFAGQNVELAFTQNPGWVSRIDGLEFVPEPSGSVLLAVGIVTLYIVLHRRRQSMGAEPTDAPNPAIAAAFQSGRQSR